MANAASYSLWDVAAGEHMEIFSCPGQSTAGTDDGWPCFVAPCDVRIKAATYTPKTAFTLDNTNYAILDLIDMKTDGSGSTSLLSAALNFTTTNNNGLQWQETAMSLSATDATITVKKGEVLQLKRTHAGTGQAQPAGILKLFFEPK